MGTRGAYGIKDDNKLWITRVNYDSGIRELGGTIVRFIDFLNTEDEWGEFSETLKHLNIMEYNKWIKLGEFFEYLVQSGEILYRIHNKKINVFPQDDQFFHDSLFCENLYLINLDTSNLEYYVGFQRVKQTGNLFGLLCNKKGYYPVRKIGEYPLKNVSCICCMELSALSYLNSEVKRENDSPVSESISTV